MPLESQLLASISRRLKKLAQADPALVWRKRHGSPMGITGDPDLYGLWHGVHWEMELKRPGQKATSLQCIRLASWKKAGALTFVAHSLAEFDVAIDTIRRAAPAKMGHPRL
jgi:hypothetical protein